MSNPSQAEKSFLSSYIDGAAGSRRHINIGRLKLWAFGLEEGSVLRRVLLVEPETMLAEEYVAKIATWLNILEVERRREVGGTWYG